MKVKRFIIFIASALFIAGFIMHTISFVDINFTFNPKVSEKIEVTYKDNTYIVKKGDSYYEEIIEVFSGLRIKLDDVSHETNDSFKVKFIRNNKNRTIYSSNLSYSNMHYYQYEKLGGYPDNMFEFYVELPDDKQKDLIGICDALSS